MLASPLLCNIFSLPKAEDIASRPRKSHKNSTRASGLNCGKFSLKETACIFADFGQNGQQKNGEEPSKEE